MNDYDDDMDMGDLHGEFMFGKASKKMAPTWEEMNERLNVEMPKRDKKRRLIIFFLAFTLIILGLFFFNNYSDTKGIKSPILADENETIKVLHETDSFSKNGEANKVKSITDAQPANASKIISNKETHQNEDLKKWDFNTTSKQSFTTKVIATNKLSNRSTDASFSNPKSILANSTEKLSSKVIPDAQIDLLLSDKNSGQDVTIIDSSKVVKNSEAFNKVNIIFNKKILPENSENTSDASVVKMVRNDSAGNQTTVIKTPPSRKKRFSKWNIYASVAPDFLIPKVNILNRSGLFLGAGVDYVFNPHFRLRAGLAYNHNQWNVDGSDYNYKPSYYLPTYNTVELQNMNEHLDVLEVPISLRYTLNPESKLFLNASAGLSSLFYLNKDCTFSVLLDGTKQVKYKHNYDDDESREPHVLNNLVLSSGIGYKLTPKLSLEVEPTFKLMMEELGEYNQSIGSLYVNFYLRIALGTK